MKTKFLIIPLTLIGLAVVLISMPVKSADSYSVYSLAAPTINSASTTATNQLFGVNTNGIWPCTLLAGQSVTNVTRIDVSGSSSITFEMNNQITVTAAATVTNFIYHIGRNVNGASPTNAIGTGLKIDWFATITNQLPSAAVANTTYTSLATFGTTTGYSSGAFESGSKAFYIGSIDAPANLTGTNYSVYVGLQ